MTRVAGTASVQRIIRAERACVEDKQRYSQLNVEICEPRGTLLIGEEYYDSYSGRFSMKYKDYLDQCYLCQD